MDNASNTQNTLQHHLTAFAANDVSEIMKDYSADAVLCTPDAIFNGRDEIRAFYTEAMKLFPPGQTNFTLKQTFITNDKAYIAWNSDSSVAAIPIGTDSFEIKDGEIVWQTLAAHIIPK